MVHLGLLLTASSALRRGVLTRGYVVASASAATKRIVFLGTPECAARSLALLLEASRADGSAFELAAVVSNPPARSGRKMKVTPSPVQVLAEAEGLPLFTPPNAKDDAFLSTLESLQPDLCVTAAYGCFLPQRFLDIPAKGTLNIHPSLLPLYRGAAPLQRCLEAGDTTGGVSVAFTVLAMDSGPILRQEERELTGEEQFPELLLDLFEEGTRYLIDELPRVWDGSCESALVAQDDDAATAAKKIQPWEAELRLTELSAAEAHNRVRAFAGGVGSWCLVSVDGAEPVRAKLLETRVRAEAEVATREIALANKALSFVCADGSVRFGSKPTSAPHAHLPPYPNPTLPPPPTRPCYPIVPPPYPIPHRHPRTPPPPPRPPQVLEVLRLTVPGKKPVDAKSFWNGLNGRKAEWAVGEVSQEEVARRAKEEKARARAKL